jgi:N,N'-diacetyllegionaminate synthase
MKRTLIIAEAGVNHNGDINLAKKLIDAAVEAGVDYVKFQTFKASNLVNKDAQKAAYQKINMQDSDNSQLSMLKKLELTNEMHDVIINYCTVKGIKFLSTPFDLESIILLKSKGIEIGKIPSGEITNFPFLRAMAQAFPYIIISTGMANLNEIGEALNVLYKYGTNRENVTVLHCNTEYPTPMHDVNLLAMHTIGNEFDVKFGYSDHTLGIEVPIAAVALGATIIEKHFTLDKKMEGPDHIASLDPNELSSMVLSIRNIDNALGNSIKVASNSEIANKDLVRKSIVAKIGIKSGEIFSENNLTTKRPGNGISPMQWDNVIGRVALRDFDEDEIISL